MPAAESGTGATAAATCPTSLGHLFPRTTAIALWLALCYTLTEIQQQIGIGGKEIFSQPASQTFLSNAWLFGNDLGDLVYFFGTGKDGFGLYRTFAGPLSLEHAEKISDTLTDFLVNGVGIDIATHL